MDAIWGGRFVTEAAVTSRIKQVRRAVGDDGQAQRVIRTVHGRGYRFVAPVRDRRDERRSRRDAADRGRSARSGTPISDGLHIAYQVSGGPRVGPDIVLISGFVSHLELDWADARHAHFLHRLGSMGRLIRFDKRGTGMSDRPPGVPDLETRMHDVLAVMDAVGLAAGGALRLLRGRPDGDADGGHAPGAGRGAGAVRPSTRSGLWSEDYPWAQTAEERAAYTDALVDTVGLGGRLPGCACPSADESMQRWWAHRMRAAATPSTVRALMDMNSLVDVRDVAARGPGADAGAAPQRRRAVQGRRGQVHRRPGRRCPVRGARRCGPLRVREPGPDPRCRRAVPRRDAATGGSRAGTGGRGRRRRAPAAMRCWPS